MSKYSFDITEPAEYDLRQINKYTSKELLKPGLAKKIVNRIANAFLP